MQHFFNSMILAFIAVAIPGRCESATTIAQSSVPKQPLTAPTLNGPLAPEQALQSFQLEPGLRIELVAAEPIVGDPVALAFDERGRMYVAENRGYPTGPGTNQPPAGIIAMLEDSDGDGRFEKRTVFAGGLTFPNGVMPWKGGVFVTCAPDVLYLKDTNGDGRADIRRTVLTGFDASNTTQLRVSHPTLGIDNWIYLTSGLTGGKISVPEHPERPAIELKTDSRFRPDTFDFEAIDGRGQFGQTFDDFGRRFICMNRVQVQHVVLPSRYLRRNPYLAFSDTVQNCPDQMLPEPLRGHGASARIYPISHNITTADSHAGTFTAACAVMIYRGTALPAEYRGHAFSCDAAGNLVHHDELVPVGATFSARRVRDGMEFLASSDDWFRPVFLANGPDGALYICDMYRQTIEHPQYLPQEIRKRTDFESGRGMGRIYRVAADNNKGGTGRARIQRPKLDRASIKELCQQLKNPNGWWCDTAHRLILERQDRAAIPILKAIVQRGPRGSAKTNTAKRAALETSATAGRVRALYLLDSFHALTPSVLDEGLTSRDPAVRENAIKLADGSGTDLDRPTRIVSLSRDADARVRFQCALAIGELHCDLLMDRYFAGSDISDRPDLNALREIALRDSADRWMRAAILSSLGGVKNADTIDRYWRLLTSKRPETEFDAEFLRELGRVRGAVAGADPFPAFTNALDAAALGFSAQSALLAGLGEGLRTRGYAPSDQSVFTAILESHPESRSNSLRQLEFISDRALAAATNSGEPTAARLSSIKFLTHAKSDSWRHLLALLNPNQPPELQTASTRAFTATGNPEAVAALLARERWNTYTPHVREACLSALISGGRHLPLLLSAVESGLISRGALDSAKRNQLLKHKNPEIRQRAEALFKPTALGDRMKVYEDYKPVLSLAPNPQNGRAVFKQHCAVCHRLDRDGVAVGPDLFGIRNQPKEAILLHVLIPEYEVVPGFAAYQVETKDGRSLSGLIASETGTSVTLRGASGQEDVVLRNNIVSLKAMALSLMPQEMEKNMARQDMADLISYLKGE